MPIDGANFAYLKTLAIDAARVFCAKASRSFDERDGRTHSYREIRRNLECLSYYLGNSLALIDDRSAEKVTIELLDFFEKHIHIHATGRYSRIEKLLDSTEKEDLVFFSAHDGGEEKFKALETWQVFLVWQKDTLEEAAPQDDFDLVILDYSASRLPEILQQANELHKEVFYNWTCDPGPGRQLNLSLAELVEKSPTFPRSYFHILLRAGGNSQHWKQADVEVEKREISRLQVGKSGKVARFSSTLSSTLSATRFLPSLSLSAVPKSLCETSSKCLCKIVGEIDPYRVHLKITANDENRKKSALSIGKKALERRQLSNCKILTLKDLAGSFGCEIDYDWRQKLNTLAYTLACAFMQLYDDPDGPGHWICKDWMEHSVRTEKYWRDPEWTSRIRLIQNSEAPPDISRPYLLAQEFFESLPLFGEEERRALCHPFPSLLDLGITLLRIGLIAKGRDDTVLEPLIRGEEALNVNSHLTAAQEALDDLLTTEDRSTSYYLSAVRACIESSQQGLDDEAEQPQIRDFIDKKVLRPLQLHSLLTTPTSTQIKAIPRGESLGDATLLANFPKNNHEEPCVVEQRFPSENFGRHEYSISRLFDDHQTTNHRSRSDWFTRFSDYTDTEDRRPDGIDRVRVGVIDTGISGSNRTLAASWQRFKRVRDFTGNLADGLEVHTKESGKSNFVRLELDTHGHGTHMAMLVSRMAPQADLFVAKVTQDGETDTERLGDVVAKAVRWAIACGVHIISMSLGIDNRSLELTEAIEEAKTRCILFAAASNCGGNGSVAWPACLPGVFSINSTDERGNKSGFNPRPFKDSMNFSTFGVEVDCGGICKSGTSYATPIAAGLAASVIEYSNRDEESRELTSRLQNFANMEAVFSEISVKIDGYDYVDPLKLWEPEDQMHSTISLTKKALRD